MANLLILYATREGQTRKIAERIADVLWTSGHRAQVVDADALPPDFSLAPFDAACLGGPIHIGGYPRSIVRFARRHAPWLAATRSGFFSVGLAVASRTTDGRAETQRLVERFMRKTRWMPSEVDLFAGALPYSKYSPLIRWIMRAIASHEGGDTDTSRDYEYTDWTQVDRFAAYFAATVADHLARQVAKVPEPAPPARGDADPARSAAQAP
jgi:menaquinone-dependent protoporphyrinogen oxidase